MQDSQIGSLALHGLLSTYCGLRSVLGLGEEWMGLREGKGSGRVQGKWGGMWTSTCCFVLSWIHCALLASVLVLSHHEKPKFMWGSGWEGTYLSNVYWSLKPVNLPPNETPQGAFSKILTSGVSPKDNNIRNKDSWEFWGGWKSPLALGWAPWPLMVAITCEFLNLL